MNTESDDRKVWEPLPRTAGTRESIKAYTAAKIYFELESERTLNKVAAQLGKSIDLMKRWSARYHWGDRAAAFDAWQAQIEQQARAKKATARAELRAEREDQRIDDDYQISVKMRNKASSMLDFPIALVTKTVDGRNYDRKPSEVEYEHSGPVGRNGLQTSCRDVPY